MRLLVSLATLLTQQYEPPLSGKIFIFHSHDKQFKKNDEKKI